MRILLGSSGALGALLLLATLGCAAQEPWEPTDLTAAVEEALVSRDVKTVLAELRLVDPAPNLYDLHHADGALARVRRLDGRLVGKILQKAGYDVELDEMEGGYRFGGELRALWIGFDRVRAEIPATHRRFSLPSRLALITVNAEGEMRATRDVIQILPMTLEEIRLFAEGWTSETGVSAAATPSPRFVGRPGPEIEVAAGGGLTFEGRSLERGDLAEALRGLPSGPPAPAVWVRPSPGATYGDWMGVLDEVYRAAEDSSGIGLALPSSDPNRYGAVLGLRAERLEQPVMVLKVDVRVPWSTVSEVLDVLRGIVPEVVFLSHLDTSSPESIGEATYPGGLPGGLPLSLEPLRDGNADVVAEKAVPERRRLERLASGEGAIREDRSPPGLGVQPRPGVLERRRRAIEERRARGSRQASSTGRNASAPEPGDEILHVGGDVRRPEKIFMPEPEYTEEARNARIQGVVIARIVIDETGAPSNIEILKGLPMGLSESALESFRNSRWKPATRNGRPVKVYYNVTLDFRLK